MSNPTNDAIAELGRELDRLPGLGGIEAALARAEGPMARAAILLLAGRRLGPDELHARTIAEVIVLCLRASQTERSATRDRATEAWATFSASPRPQRAHHHDGPRPFAALQVRQLAESKQRVRRG
jgi:hypothetical protein